MNVTNMGGVISGDLSSMGITQMTGGTVDVSGTFIAEDSVDINGAGSSASFGPGVVLQDQSAGEGSSRTNPPASASATLDVSIGSRTNCATTTDSNCN